MTHTVRESGQWQHTLTVEVPADELPPGEHFRDDVIAGLRTLGVNAAEARQIVARSGALQHTTLEASMRAAMRLLGHKTASMFLRYDVVSLDDLSDAVARAEVARNVSKTSQSADAAREDEGEQSA